MTMDEMDEIETGEWVKEGASAPWFLGKKHTPSLTTPYIPFFLDDGSLLVLGALGEYPPIKVPVTGCRVHPSVWNGPPFQSPPFFGLNDIKSMRHQ